ncbi:hypothetical protein [Cellulomonas sp. P5_C6]
MPLTVRESVRSGASPLLVGVATVVLLAGCVAGTDPPVDAATPTTSPTVRATPSPTATATATLDANVTASAQPSATSDDPRRATVDQFLAAWRTRDAATITTLTGSPDDPDALADLTPSSDPDCDVVDSASPDGLACLVDVEEAAGAEMGYGVVVDVTPGADGGWVVTWGMIDFG